MKTIKITRVCAVAVILLCLVNTKTHAQMEETKVDINQKVESLLSQMTIEEKVGQMNLYNGFWDVTGPAPEEGNAALKYDHLKKGWVGAMLTVRGAEEVRNVQRIAVEESRLGIPLLIGFDVIHGYKTLSPIPLLSRLVGICKLLKNQHVLQLLRPLLLELTGLLLQWLISQEMRVGDVLWKVLVKILIWEV